MSGEVVGARPRRPWRRALWLVLLLAAVLRVAGIFGQGFPYSFYPDETNAVQRALRFGAEGTANPGWFNKPALAYYVWFASYGALYAGGRVTGAFDSPEQFGVWAFDRVAPFLVIGRLVSTAFGVLTVWLTYLLGKRMGDRTTGLVAALALALTYAHVVTGQWVKEDVPCGFFHTASTLVLVSAMMRGRVKDSAWAGLLGGLAMATKYYSAGIFVPAAFAHLWAAPATGGRMPRRVALLFLFFLLFLGGFFIGSPYNFLVPSFWDHHVEPGLERVAQLLGIRWMFGATGMPQAHRTEFVDVGNLSIVDVWHALVESLWVPDGIGRVFCVLAVVGCGLALVRHRRRDAFMLVAIFGQASFIAVTNRQASEPRHLVVLYPLLAVWVADAVVAIARVVGRAVPFSTAGVATALLLVAAAIPAGEPSVARMLADRCLEARRGHTGVEALRYIEANVPAGDVVMNEHEILPLRVSEGRARWAINRLKKTGKKESWTYVRRWQYRKQAAAQAFRPTYDVFVVEGWGAETTETLAEHRSKYDTTWPHENVEEPRDVAPVERYTRVPDAARAQLETRPAAGLDLRGTWPASEWLVDGRPVAWVVSSQQTYDNFETPRKRREFADRAAFYDDLKANYDCLQWTAGRRGMEGPTIRLYDVRTRVIDREPAIREMND